MAVTEPAEKPQYPLLTSLRFFAALGVVFYHYGRDLPELSWSGGWVLSGHQMVTFFFVLSGFVLTVGYPRAEKSVFWKTRFWRLAPVYLLALFLTAALATADYDGLDYILSGLAIQSWLPGSALTLNRPAWSISVEVFFYLLFPLLCRCSTARAGKVAWSYWILSQLAVLAFVNHHSFQGYPSWQYELAYYWPPAHLGSFLLGVWAAKWKLEHPHRSFGPAILWVALTLALLYFRTSFESIQGTTLPWDGALHAPLFTFMVLALSHSKRADTPRFLERPTWLLLGKSSYALYILQYPLALLFTRVTGAPVRENFWVFSCLLVVASVLVFKTIETPLRYLGTHQASTRNSPPQG